MSTIAKKEKEGGSEEEKKGEGEKEGNGEKDERVDEGVRGPHIYVRELKPDCYCGIRLRKRKKRARGWEDVAVL